MRVHKTGLRLGEYFENYDLAGNSTLPQGSRAALELTANEGARRSATYFFRFTGYFSETSFSTRSE